MSASIKAPGIPASYEPVNWNPSGLPDNPDEVMAHIVDPSKRGELYPLYHQLRRLAPVHRNLPTMFHGAHTFAGFADTDELFKDPRVVNDPAVVDEAFNHGDGSFTNVMRNVMVWQHPEAHQRVRNLVKAAFTPRAMARWRPIAEDVANGLVDAFEGDGHAELVDQFNYELPFTVIARSSVFPRRTSPRSRRCRGTSRAPGKRLCPTTSRHGATWPRAVWSPISRRSSRFDVPSRATTCCPRSSTPKPRANKLSHTELIANAILLLQAGHETTQDLLCNAEVALFRHSDQLALLRDNPDLTKNAVEEFLRYDASVQVNHRVALDGATLGDIEIPIDGLIYIFLGAVNRDPSRYMDADRLDITRDLTHHLAFSFGAYYCIGSSLARTEASVGIRTLIDRLPGLRPATDSFEWRNTLQLRGPQTLEVTW